MKTRIVLIAILVIGVSGVYAQQIKTKIDPVLDSYLKINVDTEQMIDLFVHGDPSVIMAFTKGKGGMFKRSLGNISAIRIPNSNVRELAELSAVDG